MAIINSLPQYVEEKKNGLIRKAVIGSKSASLFNLMTGVKGATSLNLLDTEVVLGDGTSCGWNEAGTSKISQRILTPGYPKVNMSFCDKTLLKTYANHLVKVAAGTKTLPFEEDFINGVLENVKAQIEKTIWQGNVSGDTLTTFDGVEKVIEGTSYVSYEYASGATVASIVNGVYAAIPSEAFNKGNVSMFMGSDMYRKYIQELIAGDKLVVNAQVSDVAMPDTILIPGTNVRVYGVAGLDKTGDVYASYADNFVFGTDMQGDDDKFDFWYSQDNREFRLAIEFTAGVQIAFPELLVKGSASV